MPISIGFRVDNQSIFYAVMTGIKESPQFLASGEIKYPKSSSVPDTMVHCRNQVSQLMTKHNVTACALRTMEPSARKVPVPKKDAACRPHVEGVIILAAGENKVPVEFYIQSSIRAALQSEEEKTAAKARKSKKKAKESAEVAPAAPKARNAKGYIDAGEFRGVAEFQATKSQNAREAIIVATCELA